MLTKSGFNPRDLLNQTIGGYLLCEVLGTGNALVYRALDKGKGEYVAFKLVAWPGAPVDDMVLRRFKREIDLLRRRHHAAIIDIYDWRTAGDYVYMAMECCDGTLERWLHEHRPTLTEVLSIAEPLAAALDFLHEGVPPVLHRDIKPANILFKGPNWYISDFGIARQESDPLVTTDGSLLGTLRYAAPEQMTGGKLSAQTDIYSFGLVVYQMLAGGWALGARRKADWAYEVPPLSRTARGLPAAVDELFRRWLAADPAARPRRASEAVRELGAAAGVLRHPALARLYDLAGALAAQPHDPAAWSAASDLLATISLHEPAFRDPRGLAEELRRRQAGEAPGPPPPGYTGAHPPGFYHEQTVFAPVEEAQAEAGAPVEPPEAPGPAAPRILPPADGGPAAFAPRTRYEAAGTFVVPANTHLAGSVAGRNVVVEPGGRVDGDVYSLGDLAVGAGATIGGLALAAGAFEAGRDSRVQGAAGVQAETVALGRDAQVDGWALAGSTLTAAGGLQAAGLVAGGDLALQGPARLGSTTTGSAGGALTVAESLLLGGTPAGIDNIHPWPAPAAGGPGPAGRVVSSLLTARGRALAEAAEATAATPAALLPPHPAVEAGPATVSTGPATDGPTLYLPAALAVDPAAPPPGLPAEEAAAWEGPLAAAWLLDRAWRDYLGRLRPVAVSAGVFTLLGAGALAWLLLNRPAAGAGLLALTALVVLALVAGILWWWRPRPLELVRVWWAWETWGFQGGVLVWDTLDPGSGPGYLEPAGPLEPLADLSAPLAAPGLDDTALLAGLTDLNAALETLAWKSWPGVFAPRPPTGEEAPAGTRAASAPDELLHLQLDVPAPEALPAMRVLAPRLDPDVVRAAAERLAGWPAYQAGARAVWRTLGGHLQALDPAFDRWEAVAAAAESRLGAARTGLADTQTRAGALVAEVLSALEHEIGPDLDRIWQLHVEGTKLLGAYYGAAADAQRAAARRDGDRAAAHVAAAERDLRRQESAQAEIAAELAPLAGHWQEAAAAHERRGAELRRAWKVARTTPPPGDDAAPFVTPRPIDVRHAATLLPQLRGDADRLLAQVEDFLTACANEERDFPVDLPWPAWPARITMPFASEADLAALDALQRRLRNEPVRARARLDTLGSLRAKVTLLLERALGAQEALWRAVAEAAGPGSEGERDRLADLEAQVARVIRLLTPALADLTRWQRRLERATVAYVEVVDLLAGALKGGRSGPTWEQGMRWQAEYARLVAEQEATHAALDQARAALATAHEDLARVQAEAEAALVRLSTAEKDLAARSEAHAGHEEGVLRRHIADLRARHEAVLAGLARRDGWLAALAELEAGLSTLKIGAAERLCERIQLLAALADGRVADTAAGRAAALWPLDVWPAGDMLYLVPVWLLRYRPGGPRAAPRLLAVTPGAVRAPAPRRRLTLAAGFTIVPQPDLAGRFAAHLLTPAQRAAAPPATLDGENLLAGPALPAAWRRLAGHGLVPPWLARLL